MSSFHTQRMKATVFVLAASWALVAASGHHEGVSGPASRRQLTRLFPVAPAPTICTLPCGAPVDVPPACPPGWVASGTDAAGTTLCLGPCKPGWQLSTDGQLCLPTPLACPAGYQATGGGRSGSDIVCEGCPPRHLLVAGKGVVRPGCYRICPIRPPADSYDTPNPVCCPKCKKGFQPGTSPTICESTLSIQVFAYRRRCVARLFAPARVVLQPTARPQKAATCLDGAVTVVSGGSTSCKKCSTGVAYWATDGKGTKTLRCKCGTAADCPPGYEYCEPYCWDANSKGIVQVLGPLNNNYFCSSFLEAISDACRAVCPQRLVRPIDPIDPLPVGRKQGGV